MLLCQFGVTWAMAMAVTARYPTPKALMRALRACDSDEARESLLAGMVYDGRKKIRSDVAKIMAWLYSMEELD